jgi:ABC-type phosphate/phosphonate transport system substrate-binding protein
MLHMNARMYAAVSPAAAAAWEAVLLRVAALAGVDWALLAHRPPTPIAELWARGDLGLVQMCGLPYRLREPRPQLLAVPQWQDPRTFGKPVYWSELVVRADSTHRRLEDTFGTVAGYTVRDSMSGYVAFRSHLSRQPAVRALIASGRPLFSRVVGDLVTPRAVVEAAVQGRIDVGPVDGYAFALLRATEPALAAQVRSIGATAAVPMPPLVATALLPAEQLARLRGALAAVASDVRLHQARRVLQIEGFVPADPAYYDVLLDHREASAALGAAW